jgi:phosphate transport system permease protein
LSATISFFILIGIFSILFLYAQDAIGEFGIDFLFNDEWEVDEDDEDLGVFGGLIPIVGTMLSTLIAMVIATPIAMGIAIFLTEIAHKSLIKPVSIAIELLAAIPSIIYGMWGLFYFAPIVQSTFGGNGVGLLTAGIVLAIMIIPFMSAITRDAMNSVPDVLKESAYAMGATKFEVIKDVVMPYAKGGIIGSIILALGRALGETMAVAFLIGSVMSLPEKITDPTTSIPVLLANNFAEAQGLEMSSMYYLALILFVVSFIIISIAKFVFLRKEVK